MGRLNGRTVRANPALAPVVAGESGGVAVDPDFSKGLLANLNGLTGLLLSEAGGGVGFESFDDAVVFVVPKYIMNMNRIVNR